jgi:hypothetical protein
MKLVLENPHNVRDLLSISRTKFLDMIDFEHLQQVQTTFVARDFRHVEADVVLRGPLRRKKGARFSRTITVYILIEHQSEPDRLMPFRVLEYVMQIYKSQMRAWSQSHPSFASLRLNPVLPVVFYTGTRSWDTLGRLMDLVEMGRRFAPVIPHFKPVFVNLYGLSAARLESAGGFFGWALRLVKQRHARPDEFQGLLERVVQQLEAMPGQERLRWLELLSYIHALVYHVRNPSERLGLQEMIKASVRTDEHRREVNQMGKTIADVLKEEGRKEGEVRALRRTLLQQLRNRFKKVPAKTAETIDATEDIRQLEVWLGRVVLVDSLADIGINPTT